MDEELGGCMVFFVILLFILCAFLVSVFGPTPQERREAEEAYQRQEMNRAVIRAVEEVYGENGGY